MNWDSLVPIVTIILVNIALSGDNAVVIGCAAASLPKNERPIALAFGGGMAIILRIVLTAIAMLLISIPLVSAIGGVVLFWVAWKLLRTDIGPVQTQEPVGNERSSNFRQAIMLILTADLIMS